MITQGILDFFRDVVVNWIAGLSVLVAPVDAAGAGAAIGGVASGGGAVLWTFIDPNWWSTITAAFGAWLVVWLATALVAILGRRMAPASGGGS